MNYLGIISGAWYSILDIVARLAVITNVSKIESLPIFTSRYFVQAFLIAVTAQFIPLLVYRYRDPSPETRISSPAYQNDNLHKSLGGYVNYSLSEFPIRVLIEDDANPFPLASAIALNYYDKNDERTDFYYQPYHTSVDCFLDNDRFPDIINNTLTTDSFLNATVPYFRERDWERFTDRYDTDPDGEYHDEYLECVNQNYTCR